jgi:hypothetical protein
MTCPICWRSRKGFGWFDPIQPIGKRAYVWACSLTCQNIIARRRGVVDPTEHEIEAIQAASQPAGEYLDSIGKTDLAVLGEKEWMTLLEVIVTAYQDKLRSLAIGPELPF